MAAAKGGARATGGQKQGIKPVTGGASTTRIGTATARTLPAGKGKTGK